MEFLHPAHLLFFRDALRAWQSRGDEVKILTRDKDCLRALHRELGIPGTELSQKSGSLGEEWVRRVRRTISEISNFRPDLCVGVMGASLVPAARWCKTRSLIFYDTEVAQVSNAVVFRLANRVIVPEAFADEGLRTRKNVIRYHGYKEMAYIHRGRHPQLFMPAARRAGGELRRVLFRGISPTSVHDSKKEYWSGEKKSALLRTLAATYDLTISAEDPCLAEFSTRVYSGAISDFHAELANQDAVVTESATVAMEAAFLGKAVFYLSSSPRGYLWALERDTGLIRFAFDCTLSELLSQLEKSMTIEAVTERQQLSEVLQNTLEDPYQIILNNVAELAQNGQV